MENGIVITTGEELRRIRIDLGFSQNRLSQILEVAQPTVSIWERSETLSDNAKTSLKDKWNKLFPNSTRDVSRVVSSKVFTVKKEERYWKLLVDSGLFTSYQELAYLLNVSDVSDMEKIIKQNIRPEGKLAKRLEVLNKGVEEEKDFLRKLPVEMIETIMSFVIHNNSEVSFRKTAHFIQRSFNRILIEINPRDIADGDYFRRVRINYRMTQKEMAIVMEMVTTDIAKFERGEIPFPECVKRYRYLHNIWEKDDVEEIKKVSNWIITKRFDILGDYLKEEA